MTSPNESAFTPAAPSQERGKGYTESSQAPTAHQQAALHGWSLQDTELRERWLKGEIPQDIADALGRSIAAIMTRAARLGLPRRFAPGRKPGQRNTSASARTPMAPDTRGTTADAHFETDSHAVEAEPAQGNELRLCLMCASNFQSLGRHNRICPKCKVSPDYAAGCRVTDVNFEV